MTCDECKSLREPRDIPYIAHEAAMARAERTQKRLWIIILVLIILLFGTNSAWLYYESQFEDVTATYEASTDSGGTAIANGEGSVNYYGESESNDHPQG